MAATAADGDVAINETNFPDANFRTFVELHFDADHYNILSASELAAVTCIDCYNENISSLTGIEYFTNLEELICNFNELTSLDVSKNTNLETLYCSGNQLTSLDISKNTKLNPDFFEVYDNCYAITAVNNMFDLSTLPGSFDVKKASNWNGATVTNSKLTVPDGVSKVNYTYNIGQNRSKIFTLWVTHHNHSWSADWSSDETAHWHECTVTGCPTADNSEKDGYALHTDKITDHICDICGKTLSEHTGGKATCTEKAVCNYCGKEYGDTDPNNHDLVHHEAQAATCTKVGWNAYDTCKDCNYTTYTEIPALKHMLVWQSENGQYWQECTREGCNYATAKQAVPTVSVDGADTVCRTQNYTFSFTVPENCTLINAGYEFEMRGSELDATLDNGIYTATLEATAYAADEDSFKITVKAQTADGFIVKVEKAVTIQNEHSGGVATCKGKAVCTVCGEEYGDLAPHELTHIAAKAATAAELGNTEYWYCDVCDKCFSDENAASEIALTDTVVAKLAPTIISGGGATVTEGEKKTLSFTSDAAFDDFLRVEVDDKTVDESNYTVKSGSSVVTLSADYIATLSVGEHTIGIVSQSGTAMAKFTVNKKAEEAKNAETTTTPSNKTETTNSTKTAIKNLRKQATAATLLYGLHFSLQAAAHLH